MFKESWTAKKSRIRASSPWGHLANWDVSLPYAKGKRTDEGKGDLGDREDWDGFKAGTIGDTADRAIQSDLQGGKI